MGKWLVPESVGPEFVQYQIPETYHAGAIPAKVLFEEMGGSGNVVVILGPKGHIGSYRYEGFKQAAEEYPDINVLAHQYSGGWTRKKGRQVMSAFVSNYGDDIDGVYCNNGTLGLGAASILSENDMAIPFTGFDGALSNIEYLNNNGPDSGEPYQVQEQAAPPFWQGGWAVAKAWDWLHGWRPKTPERMLWVRTLTVLNPGSISRSSATSRRGSPRRTGTWTSRTATVTRPTIGRRCRSTRAGTTGTPNTNSCRSENPNGSSSNGPRITGRTTSISRTRTTTRSCSIRSRKTTGRATRTA